MGVGIHGGCMRIGIPIEEDRGQDSPICAHFGGAPAFLVVDTEQDTYESISNAHEHEAHGQCVPVDLLGEQKLDVMLVSGIGRGAMMKLGALGVRIYRAQGETARDSVRALLTQLPPELGADHACEGHDHGGCHEG